MLWGCADWKALAWPWMNVDEKRWPLNAWLEQLKNPTPPPTSPLGPFFFIIIY